MAVPADVNDVTGTLADAHSAALELAAALDRSEATKALGGKLEALVSTVRGLPTSDLDPSSVSHLLRGALEISEALRSGPASTEASLRLGVETVLQSLDRLIEDDVVADRRPLSEIVDWLLRTTHMSPPHLARLIDVAPSTVRRWQAEPKPDSVETDEMARARLLAHVVVHLNQVLTPRGVVTWLETPHPALKQDKPVELLRDVNAFADLVSLASQGRSQIAS